MAQIGHMHANGDGVPQSNSTALDWFLKSIDGKNPDPSGLFGIGYMYLHGYGVEQNITEAIEWLQGAAKRHHAEALYHLGIIRLEDPLKTPEEAREAIQNIQDAAAVRACPAFLFHSCGLVPVLAIPVLAFHGNSPGHRLLHTSHCTCGQILRFRETKAGSHSLAFILDLTCITCTFN
jgi:TPR repeat protein